MPGLQPSDCGMLRLAGKGRCSRDFTLKTHLRSANGALEEMFREYDDDMRVGGRCKLGFGFL